MAEQTASLRPVLRLADLATFFGVSRTTVYEWRKSGRLQPIEHLDPGGRPYYLDTEVLEWAKGDLALSEMTGEAVA